MISFLQQHQFVAGLVVLWAYSAAIGALQTPTAQSSAFYKWFFTFAKTIAGDLGSTFGKYLPSAGTGATAAIAILCGLLVMAPVIGCSQAAGENVAQDIVNWTPALVSAVSTIDATASTLLPADAPIFTAATAAFDANAALVKQYAEAYLANPSASVLANLQTAITTLQQDASAALLQADGIKDSASQQKALAAINGLATIANTILALVEKLSTKAQVAAMAQHVKVHLAQVRPLMDQAAMAAVAARYHVTTDQFFAAEAQAGF